MFCCAVFCVLCCLALTSIGTREIVAVLCLSFCCLLTVALPHHAMGLYAVCEVVFSDHTHLPYICFKKLLGFMPKIVLAN